LPSSFETDIVLAPLTIATKSPDVSEHFLRVPSTYSYSIWQRGGLQTCSFNIAPNRLSVNFDSFINPPRLPLSLHRVAKFFLLAFSIL
jgi:hypothetical protein